MNMNDNKYPYDEDEDMGEDYDVDRETMPIKRFDNNNNNNSNDNNREDNGLANYSGYLDFKGMFDHAIKLFAEQALCSEGSKKDISLLDIELTKAKANNFNESLANIMALSHDLEIMSAERDRFKRKDELDLLNNLRKQCEIQASMCMRNMLRANEVLNNSDELTVEDVVKIQGVLDSSIDSTQRIIASTSRLIQLERFSGNRLWGARASKSANISYIQKLEEGNESTAGGSSTKNGNTPTRKLSLADIDKLNKPVNYNNGNDYDD